MNIGFEIMSIRKERKMTQEEFAQLFSVTRQTVSNWENEKNYPDLQTLVDISEKFEISLDKLLKEDDKMIKNLDEKIKKGEAAKKILKIGGTVTIIIVISIIVYIGIWNNRKKDIEGYFQTGIEEQGFVYNKVKGYYTLEEQEVYFRLPNQKMPSATKFKFDLMAKYVDAQIDNNNRIDMRIMDGNVIVISFNNENSSCNLNEEGELSDSKISEKNKQIYENTKDEIVKMVKKGLEIYNAVYTE